MKRYCCLLLALLTGLLCGCASIYDRDYVSISDYTPTVQEAAADTETVTVHSLSGLRRALQAMVYAGQTEGRISFDPGYDGEGKEDMASACWQLRTQDALCAYCVQDITYEYSTIVSRDEAAVHIRYAESADSVENIQMLSYAAGLEDILLGAMEDNSSRVVLLIAFSSYSAADMRQLVTEVYRARPLSAMCEPRAEVYMYSGSGRQRLYEINFVYALGEDERLRRRAQLVNLDVKHDLNAAELDAPQAALAACEYLADNCRLSEESGRNTVYDALVAGSADSEGLALAYVEMCRQLGISCRAVYGQRAWQDHCWNIIELSGAYYHVDVSACAAEGMEYGFLRSDASIWSSYRWDTSSYPRCEGGLSYGELMGYPAPPAASPADGDDTPPETEIPVLTETDAPEEGEGSQEAEAEPPAAEESAGP